MPTRHPPIGGAEAPAALRRLVPRLAIVAIVAILAGCSSSRSVTSGTADAIETTTSTAVVIESSVTEQSTSTVGDSVPPDTQPTPVEFVLRSTGIGAFDFGLDVATTVEGVSAQLGEPSSINSIEYPLDAGSGQYTTADGELGYLYPFGRSVCWAGGWCAEFGGGGADSLFFTGWHYASETGGALATADGVTIASRWSDFPSIEVAEGGCYSTGSGEVGGVRLAVVSSGLQFTEFDASGNYVTNIPDPADVTVMSMEAGEIPLFLFGDC